MGITAELLYHWVTVVFTITRIRIMRYFVLTRISLKSLQSKTFQKMKKYLLVMAVIIQIKNVILTMQRVMDLRLCKDDDFS
jgi:hypothetical protein